MSTTSKTLSAMTSKSSSIRSPHEDYQEKKLVGRSPVFPKDLFFHPIVCHICKRLNNRKISCDCGMVSYCCKEHLDKDHLDHKEFCSAMKIYKKLVQEKRVQTFTESHINKWHDYKLKRLSTVQKRLSRKLYRHEKEMIMFSRWCRVCYAENNLRHCPRCFTVDYCKVHYKKLKNDEHECEKLKEWLYFEIQAIDVYPIPQYCRKFHDFPDRSNINDMFSFYETYLLPEIDAPWTILDTVYSDYLSGPLTVYYGMQDAKLSISPKRKSIYVIHIIDTDFEDRETLKQWEMFLHAFKEKTNLFIVLIGFELRSELGGTKGNFEICWEKCMLLSHTLNYKHYRMSYENYVKNDRFIEPDLIVGFHTKLRENLILALKSQLCPIILTAKTKEDAENMVNTVRKRTGGVKPILSKINNFRGCRPYLTDLKHDTYYRNNYLTIYKKLSCSI